MGVGSASLALRTTTIYPQSKHKQNEKLFHQRRQSVQTQTLLREYQKNEVRKGIKSTTSWKV